MQMDFVMKVLCLGTFPDFIIFLLNSILFHRSGKKHFEIPYFFIIFKDALTDTNINLCQLESHGYNSKAFLFMCWLQNHKILKSYTWKLFQGKKPMEIAVLCRGWAESRSHMDVNNRQFYPTPQDIKYLAERHVDAKRWVHYVYLNALWQSGSMPILWKLTRHVLLFSSPLPPPPSRLGL